MQNERIRVFELAKELHVPIGDIQFALATLRLPTRQQSTGWISGQHADVIRRGLRQGAWRPRTTRRDEDLRRLFTRPSTLEPRSVPVRCICCETWFQVLVVEGEAHHRICHECLRHQIPEGESETDKARADRLEAHLAKLRSWNDLISKKNTEMNSEKQEAFRTRNSWRRALVEVMQGHVLDDSDPDDLCLCGAPFPCVTRRLLGTINPGIASQVERFEQMHARQREMELSGETWTANDEHDYQMQLRLNEIDVDEAS